MTAAAPRWAILLATPLLIGAVLLMHGLDAAAHLTSTTVSAGAEHGGHHDGDEPCTDCPSGHHLVIACVAVAATIATLVRARLRPGRLLASAAVASAATPRDRIAAVARPPDPAWVRLSVMRC
jgi:hypothetical protein